jgi:hypothetical protein
MEQQTPATEGAQLESPAKNALRFGAIIGLVSIGITVLLYAIDYALLVQLKVLFIMLAIYIGMVIYGGINYRKQVGGYLSYGKAFQHGFVALVVASIIGILFSVILYNVIDTELPQKLTDATVENTEEMMRNFGAPEDQLDTQLEKVRKDTEERFTALGLVKQFGIGLIINAVLAAITALFVKRKEPEVMM